MFHLKHASRDLVDDQFGKIPSLIACLVYSAGAGFTARPFVSHMAASSIQIKPTYRVIGMKKFAGKAIKLNQESSPIRARAIPRNVSQRGSNRVKWLVTDTPAAKRPKPIAYNHPAISGFKGAFCLLGIPEPIHRRKSATLSWGHAPSLGMVQLSSRVRICAARADVAVRPKIERKAHRLPVHSSEERIDALREAQGLIRPRNSCGNLDIFLRGKC